MGRKSALTPEQWVEVERRHFVDGESVNALAKRFGVNESIIRRKIKPNKAEGKNTQESLRDLALRKLDADRAANEIAEEIAELPISRQNTFNDIYKKLGSITLHLTSAAEFGAATAHRLSGIANAQVDKISDSDPMESQEVLQGISALTKMANDASQIGMNLLAANKEQIKEMNQVAKPVPQRVTVEVVNASVNGAEA